MKGSGMWLSRRQVRWLVILLALLPMVPAIEAMRMTLDNARRERDEAVEVETKIHREQLIHLLNRTSRNAGPEMGGDELFAQLRRIFGEDSTLTLGAPEAARTWREGGAPSGEAITVMIQDGRFTGWTVVLDRVVDLPDYIRQQMLFAWLRAAGWAAGVGLVAAVAWFAVHRGLRLDELRSDLLTTVSHEMKTPLASMRILLETLADDGGEVVRDEAMRRDYLEMSLRENLRLTRLAEDFLTFARLERGDGRVKRVECDLREIVEGTLHELRPAILSAKADVRRRLVGAKVWGDPEGIAAVVRNLVENALKYGRRDGQTPEILVEAETDSADGSVRLHVSDRGPGIPASHAREVFRQYFQIDDRLSRQQSGVGLGLPICRHLIKQMKGGIALAPNPGGGCLFTVTFASTDPAVASFGPVLSEAVAYP